MAAPRGAHVTTGTVVVTGASGFIGSALVRHLARENVPVTATARRRAERLTEELGRPVYALDVMGDLAAAQGVFSGAETLVHCATSNDIQSRADDGGLTLSVSGTYRLVEWAVRQGVRRVVYLSTLQVYGTELYGAVNEATSPRCETAYALNHFLGEEVCRLAAARHGIDVVALRPSNVYGVPSVSTVERSTLVPMCFVQDAVKTGKVELRSSGRQRRNFISTDEVAESIGALIDDFPRGFTLVNAVSDWHASVVDIARLLAEVWRSTQGHDLTLNVLSDEPATPNEFQVTSRALAPRRTRDQSQQHMFDVIADLITKFQHENASPPRTT